MEDGPQEQDDRQLLDRMLILADRLAGRGDALMEGQYGHLRDRVAALIALRSFADDDAA